MDKQQYSYSVAKLRNMKKRFVYIQVLFPLILLMLFYFHPQFGVLNAQAKIVIFCVSLIMIEAILIIQPKIMLKKIAEKKVCADESNIEVNDGKFVEKIPYGSITKIKIISDQADEIVGLNFFYSGKSMRIDFIDDVSDLLKHIEPFLNTETLIVKKSVNTNWQNPALVVPIMLITIFSILYFRKVVGELSYEFFKALFSIGLGFSVLIFRFISKISGKRFRKFETIIGYTLIVSGSFMLFSLIV